MSQCFITWRCSEEVRVHNVVNLVFLSLLLQSILPVSGTKKAFVNISWCTCAKEEIPRAEIDNKSCNISCYKCCELPSKQQHIVRTFIVAFLKRKGLLWKVQADITNLSKVPLTGISWKISVKISGSCQYVSSYRVEHKSVTEVLILHLLFHKGEVEKWREKLAWQVRKNWSVTSGREKKGSTSHAPHFVGGRWVRMFEQGRL